jgi:tetraprenyl-beta-curcumene synthase
LALTFARAAGRYWLSVFPRTGLELAHWRRRAERIGDPVLRTLALEALQTKRRNPEGAAAFAVLAAGPRRLLVVRALVAFQTLYDYLDTLSEQPAADPIANGNQLHRALVVALDPGAPQRDYYKHSAWRDDGGYLEELVDACREACDALPAYGRVGRSARLLADRIADYQGLNNGPPGSYERFRRWANRHVPSGTGLLWWEIAAAAGSSLGIHALIASAADPGLGIIEAAEVQAAYAPWIGGLHTLLDSLVDRPEDIGEGHHSFVGHYASPHEAAERLGAIAQRSLELARRLPQGAYHELILAGMTSYYLAAPEAYLPEARAATGSVLAAMGSLARPTLLVHRMRQTANHMLG